MQLSDSLFHFGRGYGLPSPAAAGTSSWSAARVPAYARRVGDQVNRFLRLPVFDKDEGGSPRLLGHPLPACRGHRSRRVSPILAQWRIRHCCFRAAKYLEHPGFRRFRDWIPRPTRSCAYASPTSLPVPPQGSLPTGRAHPSSGGDCTRWMTSRSFVNYRTLLSDQQGLVALGTLRATPYSRPSWSTLRSSISWLRMYSRITASSRPTVETK